MTVADRIRKRREELQLTQEELAKRMGYSTKTTISRIESSGDNVSRKTIERIAVPLKTTPRALMGWDEEQQEGFYINQKTAQIAERIYQDRYMGMVFDALDDSSPEEIKDFYDMLMVLKRRERRED